jgi:hypothetical protein
MKIKPRKPGQKFSQSSGQKKKEIKKKAPKVDWLNRLLFMFWPKIGIRYFAKKMGIDDSVARQAHELFKGVEKIDLFPSDSGLRGFILVLDRKTSLYFYQDGEHFKYDGYEIGEYKKGDITLFDGIEKRQGHRYQKLN